LSPFSIPFFPPHFFLREKNRRKKSREKGKKEKREKKIEKGEMDKNEKSNKAGKRRMRKNTGEHYKQNERKKNVVTIVAAGIKLVKTRRSSVSDLTFLPHSTFPFTNILVDSMLKICILKSR